MGLEQLDTALPGIAPVDDLPAEEVAWGGEELTDEAALKIVLGDVARSEMLTQGHNAAIDWENWDNLYRAIPVKNTWPGTESQRASLTMPVILEAVEKLMPSIYLAFFSDKQPFLFEALGRTTPQAARGNAHLVMWAIKQADFKEQIRRTLKSCLLYGTGIARTGWKIETRKQATYSRTKSGSVKRKVNAVDINHPTLDHIEIRNVLVDHGLREQDCRKGRYVIAQLFLDAEDVCDLVNDDTYKNIPSREEMLQALVNASEATPDSMKASKYMTWRDLQATPQEQKTSVDPTKQPLEVLEYVCDTHIITILERLIVIRNEPNEDECKNYYSSSFIDCPGSFYGFGVGKLLSGEQLLQSSVVNKWLDALALILNPAFTETKGLGTGSQQVKLSPGKILSTVGTLTPIPIPSVTKEAMDAINASEQRAVRRVGANGGDEMPTQAMRTAQGVQAFNQNIVDKLQYFIEQFSDLVYVPILETLLETCKKNLQPDEVKQILSDAEAKEWNGDVLDVYNGRVSITTLSSTKLAARRAAAQLVPLLLQLVSSQPFQDSLMAQGKKFDYAEFMEEVMDLAGWDVDNFIVPATPQEQQQLLMARPGVAAAAAQQQKSQSDLQNQLQVIEAEGEMRAGVQVIKHTLSESGKETPAGLPTSIPGVE